MNSITQSLDPPENYKPTLYDTHDMESDGPRLVAMYFARMSRKFKEEKKRVPSSFEKAYVKYLETIFDQTFLTEILPAFEEYDELMKIKDWVEEKKNFRLTEKWPELWLDNQRAPFDDPKIGSIINQFKREMGFTPQMELHIKQEKLKEIDEHADEYDQVLVKPKRDEFGYITTEGLSEIGDQSHFDSTSTHVFCNPQISGMGTKAF